MRWVRLAVVAALVMLLLLPRQVLGNSSPAKQTTAASDLVLIVIDGFRPDYLSLAPMHHLHMLMAGGMSYSRAWVGQLETQTPSGHATIATGAYPRKHGVIGFVWKDPTGQSITWMPTDRALINAGDMERLIESGGVPSIADLIHRASPGARVVSVSSEKIYAADAMGVGADYIVWGDSYGANDGWIVPTAIGKHVPPASTRFRSLKVRSDAEPIDQDAFATRMALQLFHTAHPRALLVNLPGVDIEGHRDGGVVDTTDMRETVRAVDNDIGKTMNAYRQAGRYDHTLFVVTADHGMIPNSALIPRQSMYNAVASGGAAWLEEDFLGTAGYVFLRNPDDAPRLATLLTNRHFKGVEGALYKTAVGGESHFVAEPGTAKRLGPDLTQAYQDLSDTLAASNGPDIVLPYAEDTLGVTPKGLGPRWGTHGGLSWRVQHIPLVLSGPGVRHGSSAFPAKLVDVAPTIERIMGLPVPATVDGAVLGNALAKPSVADETAQQAVRAQRSRDVDVLRRHSLQQHGIALSTQ